jgi:hypothetical protein
MGVELELVPGDAITGIIQEVVAQVETVTPRKTHSVAI